MTTNNMKAIDLFCGCGGLSKGIENAGFEVVFANDIDSNCLETYKKNFSIKSSDVVCCDIRDLNKKLDCFDSKFNNIDLVCGGPPCQGFSMANRQRVIDDPRNFLYKEYLIFLKRVKPKFFVMENVKGMLNKIGEILSDMKEFLGAEYNVAYSIFNVKDFGVPQSRARLIVIGNRIRIDSSKIISNIKMRNKDIKQHVLKDAIGDLPELKPNRVKNNSKLENDDVGYFSRPFIYEKTEYVKFVNNGKDVKILFNHKNRFNNDRDIEIYTRLPQGANSLHESIADIMPYKSRNQIFKDKYFKLDYSKVCKTITSHMKFDCNMYIHPTQSRGLSPREAARIQTFPDDFVFYGPQNDWYKQIGNAVPVKFAQIIGEEIAKCL